MKVPLICSDDQQFFIFNQWVSFMNEILRDFHYIKLKLSHTKLCILAKSQKQQSFPDTDFSVLSLTGV